MPIAGAKEMLSEVLVRFALGGLMVSLFAALGDTLTPKTFAGLLGAAPSVAVVTLALAQASRGPEYVALEARSLVAGVPAFLVYGALAAWLVRKRRFSAWIEAAALWSAWLLVAFTTYQLALT